MRASITAVAIAAVMALSSRAGAEEGPTSATLFAPAEDKVFAGCRLSDSTIGLILDDIEASAAVEGDEVSAFAGAEIDFLVVYAINNDNTGQLFDDGSSEGAVSGPVLCSNPNTTDVSISAEDETELGVDILDADEQLQLPILADDGEVSALIERVCQTVDSNVDCVDLEVAQ